MLREASSMRYTNQITQRKHRMNKQKYRHAFTLVELSIVLVILGLLVGGILGGQALIHASELRAVTTEYQTYKTAIGSFKEKYASLPGDMYSAVSVWGVQAGAATDGSDVTCRTLTSTTPSTDTRTCNGNGNGVIDFNNTEMHESLRGWQHLANAGMIEGSFTGVRTASNSDAAGENIPASKFQPGGWKLRGMSSAATGDTFAANYGTTVQYGGRLLLKTDIPLITPGDMYNIDTKMDDGLPQSGTILGYKYAALADCATSTDDAYALDITTTTCVPIFITGY
jgi:prepilin-type N-terminal cleavage/methylation domain-containing protein